MLISRICHSEYCEPILYAVRHLDILDGHVPPKPFFIYAEDDPDAVVLVRAALRKIGAEDCLIHTPDGNALTDCLRDAIIGQTLPAFVLLDIKMPRAGGFDALRWIRLMPQLKALPVVIISASSRPEDVELATALGATSYLIKPTSYEDLCARLRELLIRFNLIAG